ncbi:MAG: Nramp family divalent metal transporter [Pirellulales bacterium]|nr:Nramp family divalent metal transporter [Pirellulales bacterium]
MKPSPTDQDGDPATIDQTEAPPQTIIGILSRLGPGLIIAAAIVGSGELIATTKTGAAAGFTLLWLILIGCVIKVFAQVEIGRFTMTEGRTALDAFDQVPGPRMRVNWLCWYWLFMFIASIGQLGGIVGVVGQSLAIAVPITNDYNVLLAEQQQYDAAKKLLSSVNGPQSVSQENITSRPQRYTTDDLLWAVIITAATSLMLVIGRYGFVQHASTLMVAIFTVVSIINLIALQSTAEWHIGLGDIWGGLTFQFPDNNGIQTALATFGIIGVGASELVAYPYWCLEKGYARAAGQRDDTAAWGERARGWLRVLRWDAWVSLGVYTFATVAFYLTGATVLHRQGLEPGDDQVVPTLMEMYRPVFGVAATYIFLVGAFAVLYSTFFVASAGNARMAADALRVFRCGVRTPSQVKLWTVILSGAIPIISLAIFAWNKNPVTLILISGLAQAVMLPMLGGAALYYRYYRCDARLRPGIVWDAGLWISFAGLLLAGGWITWDRMGKLVAKVSELLTR